MPLLEEQPRAPVEIQPQPGETREAVAAEMPQVSRPLPPVPQAAIAPPAEVAQRTDEMPPVAIPEEFAINRTLRNEGADAGMLVDTGSRDEPVVSYVSDEELAERLAIAPAAAAGSPGQVIEATPSTVASADGESYTAEGSTPDDTEDVPAYDIEREVSRLLKNRRWNQSDNPFSGFKSPPGRF
jgi:hypothetical protein